ncbi:uncharacterized protein LOC132262928 [Phlebotomus argentipes]|uniref:uncharacterized protein LOC132262928 n=1 Tax=Phlebotomus argentipes TaxID=94469 RepID=UPI002892CB01|nr:uncharacterized protein LOC132262928 [Phlebotomus argentipes]
MHIRPTVESSTPARTRGGEEVMNNQHGVRPGHSLIIQLSHINSHGENILSCLLGAMSDEPDWLEEEALGGFRVWQLIFLCASGALSFIIVLCCCFRFRIPRTKQDIEADYQRRKIAKKFRERLACIHNSEMDDMNLQKAVERVRADFLASTDVTSGKANIIDGKSPKNGVRV